MTIEQHCQPGTEDVPVDRPLVTQAEGMNVGAMPHEQFMAQIRLFGTEVLPKLHAHRITRVPNAA